MEKTINIGGRLHNPAVGGAVTGANEIKDDTKGKMQNVINQETDAELVRLDEAKQNNLTFDQSPTENSTNPVTSGGVYSADAALQQAIEAILLLIPSAASALNQLADKSFVNSSIATATATFRGTYNLITDLELTVSATHQQIATALASIVSTADNNDYCFVQIPVSDQSTDIRVTERYKFDGTSWEYEYDLNNSGFTADQWGAINSGITSVLVGKLGGLPTAAELATLFAGKQNTLTFDNTPVAGSDNPVKSSGLYNAFAAINAIIPEGADANNKLVAESRLVAYVTTLINALDATFDLTSADGHVTLRMTQADGVITSVQILTSDIASASALTTLGGRVSTAEADIDALQEAYAALTQSDVVIVEGALPSSGQQQNIIYRQPDQDHTPPQFYSDYMWNGTTWVLMATYMNAIDPRPKKGSQNLVTSGGVFDNMGALDVSELNATENPHTLATYADLSAALAAIPSDYQKGGMSIKFVLTSDNKYVQYRLMATSFSTTVTDWQGVSDGIIAGSNDLAKSWDVLKSESKIINLFSVKGKAIYPATGNLYDANDASVTDFIETAVVDFIKGIIYDDTHGNNNVAGLAWYDENKTFISIWDKTGSPYYDNPNNPIIDINKADIPSNAVYFRCTASNTRLENGTNYLRVGSVYNSINSNYKNSLHLSGSQSVTEEQRDNMLNNSKIGGIIKVQSLLSNKNLSYKIRNFFLDFYCNPAYKIYVKLIRNGQEISDRTYWTYVVDVYDQNDTLVLSNFSESFPIHTGIEFFASTAYGIKFLVDWDSISDIPGEITINSWIESNPQFIGNKFSTRDFLTLNGYVTPIVDASNSSLSDNKLRRMKNALLDFTTKKDTYLDVTLVDVAKGTANGSYVRVGLRYNEQTPYGVIAAVSQNPTGIELLSNSTGEFSILINWDAINSNEIIDINLPVNTLYLKQHYGPIYCIKGLENAAEKENYSVLDQFFVKDGELHANSNYRANSDTLCAKYYQVDLGAKITAVRCRFKAQNSGNALLMLITTNNNSPAHISNITNGSNHSGFSNAAFQVQAIIGGGNPNVTEMIIYSNTLTPGQVYECGYDFLGNDDVKVYLPDGTNQTVNIPGIDAKNGQYFIMEYYKADFAASAANNLNDWYPILTGIKVECDGKKAYKDDFKKNGLLTVSPSGHVYTSFRNVSPNDDKYQVTNY